MGTLNHYSFLSLAEGKNSVVFYSKNKPKTLFVFVHGFKGVSVATWNSFIPLLLQDSVFSLSDFLFYGYDSLEGQVYDQSQELRKFIDKYHSPGSGKLFRASSVEYDKIIIVAHSLGAVVTRFALLSSITEKHPWVAKAEMVLFAPAHNGSRIHKLLGTEVSNMAGIMVSLFFYHNPIMSDLQERSHALIKLREETESYRGRAEQKILTAKNIHAFGDKVVYNAPFCYDETFSQSPVKRNSHTAICKPIASKYLLPIELIKERL